MSSFDGTRKASNAGTRFGGLRGGDSKVDMSIPEKVEEPKKEAAAPVEEKKEEKPVVEAPAAEAPKPEEKTPGAKDIAAKIKEQNKLALKAKEEAKKEDPNRKINRTFYLKASNLDALTRYAKKNGLTIGNVVDFLIEENIKD